MFFYVSNVLTQATAFPPSHAGYIILKISSCLQDQSGLIYFTDFVFNRELGANLGFYGV